VKDSGWVCRNSLIFVGLWILLVLGEVLEFSLYSQEMLGSSVKVLAGTMTPGQSSIFNN
jgi:hypothetical protein